MSEPRAAERPAGSLRPRRPPVWLVAFAVYAVHAWQARPTFIQQAVVPPESESGLPEMAPPS